MESLNRPPSESEPEEASLPVQAIVNDETSLPEPGDLLTFKELKAKENKSVLDYYLLLPESFFGCEKRVNSYPRRITERNVQELADWKAKVEYLQEKKGYLRTKHRTVALFKDRQRGKDYIAITNNFEGMTLENREECPNARLIFLKEGYRKRNWNYARNLYPPYYQQLEDGVYLLPENGTTIKVFKSRVAYAKGEAGPVHSLLWKAGAFCLSFPEDAEGELPAEFTEAYLDESILKHGLFPAYDPQAEDEEEEYPDLTYKYFDRETKSPMVGVFISPPCHTELCSDEFHFFRFDRAQRIWFEVTDQVFPEQKIEKQLVKKENREMGGMHCGDCEGYRIFPGEAFAGKNQIGITLTVHPDGFDKKETYGGVFSLKEGELKYEKPLE